MHDNRAVLISSLRNLRFHAEIFREQPRSAASRTALLGPVKAAKAALTTPLQPGSEQEAWRANLRRHVKRVKLALESEQDEPDLEIVHDTSGLFLRLLASLPQEPRAAISN